MGWPPGNLGAWKVWGQPSCGLLGVLMLLECGEAYKFLLHLLLSHYGSPSPPRGGGAGQLSARTGGLVLEIHGGSNS